MFLCVTVFPVQNPKGNREKWYVWNFLYCRDLSILKFITTIHRATDPRFLDKETDSQKGHLFNFTLLSDGWKQKTDPFASIFTPFPLCQRFPDWVPRAQGQGETHWPPHCGEGVEKKGCLTRCCFPVFISSRAVLPLIFYLLCTLKIITQENGVHYLKVILQDVAL